MSFSENSNRLKLESIPRSKYSIRVFHLYPHRDPDGIWRRLYGGTKHRNRYMTVAQAIDRETQEPAFWAVSICGKRDTPNRRVGSGIALGRLVKAYHRSLSPSGNAPEAALNAQGEAIEGVPATPTKGPLHGLRIVR